jgi:hypothetical protein
LDTASAGAGKLVLSSSPALPRRIFWGWLCPPANKSGVTVLRVQMGAVAALRVQMGSVDTSPLQESQRLMREREERQVELEERIQESRRRLAHSEELLQRLKKLLNS